MTELQGIKNVGPGSTDFGDGIAVSASADKLVRNNVVRGNGAFSGIGVFAPASMRNVIDRNVVEDNNVQTNANVNQDDGIRLEPFISENVVTNNRVHGNGLDGIASSVGPRTIRCSATTSGATASTARGIARVTACRVQ